MIDDWVGFYGEAWSGMIDPAAFAHPAKFSRALIRKIYDHAREEGWIVPGTRVIDPFGGVALGALDAMRCGCEWAGVELELKFQTLGTQNIIEWDRKFGGMPNWGNALLMQGDSRRLSKVLSDAGICVSSPPYGNDTVNDRNGIHMEKCKKAGGRTSQGNLMADYGHSAGQLTGLKATEKGHSLAISSPPFHPQMNAGGNAKSGLVEKWCKQNGRNPEAASYQGTSPSKQWGEGDGQIGSMKEGSFEAAISSPPFESVEGSQAGRKHKDPEAVAEKRSQGYANGALKGNSASKKSILAQLERENGYNYGETEGQLGISRGEDFWSASRLILEELFKVIRPGGHAIFVVKSFVRNKKIVDFPGQWAQLCEAVGFELLHDHHAMVTEEFGTQGGMFGVDKTMSVSRKSFFRRLAESKGSPKIDWENVLCFSRP